MGLGGAWCSWAGLLGSPHAAWPKGASEHLAPRWLSSCSGPDWVSHAGNSIPKEPEQEMQGLSWPGLRNGHFCHSPLVRAHHKVRPDSRGGEMNPPLHGRSCKEMGAIFICHQVASSFLVQHW